MKDRGVYDARYHARETRHYLDAKTNPRTAGAARVDAERDGGEALRFTERSRVMGTRSDKSLQAKRPSLDPSSSKEAVRPSQIGLEERRSYFYS